MEIRGRVAAALLPALVWISAAFGQTAIENGIVPIKPSGTSDEPLKTTLCELTAHPSRFAGQYIEVRATHAGNFEMSILVDDSCPRSDVVVWYGQGLVPTDVSQYAFIDSIDDLKNPDDIRWRPPAPVNFRATQDSKRMSEYVQKHRKKGELTFTATFRGRFDYIPRLLAVKGPDGKVTVVSAFGHQNCCSARLQPESVTEFTPPKR
jgi:hypothetical protein